jgi:hypothetical protein
MRVFNDDVCTYGTLSRSFLLVCWHLLMACWMHVCSVMRVFNLEEPIGYPAQPGLIRSSVCHLSVCLSVCQWISKG